MNRILKSTLLFFVFVGLFSCKDDDTVTIYVVPYAEQEPIDNAAIVEFLTNNYFNEEEFIAPVVNFSYDIEFSTDQMAGSYTRTPLIDYVNTVINNFTIETKTITVSDVDHTLYILKIVQGLGTSKPRFCDEAFLSYEGMTLEKDVFDNALNPVKLDLSATVKGFSESVSEFNIADNVDAVGDGTFDYENYGVGAVFMPSGLGYYASPAGGISAYAPLIFKLKVYGTTVLDHDSDGVPTYVEDLNGNHDLSDDNTDLDIFPNFLDPNDDNDPILSKNEANIVVYPMFLDGSTEPMLGVNEYEIERVVNDNVVPNEITITTATYIDTDGDGVLDYLDSDS